MNGAIRVAHSNPFINLSNAGNCKKYAIKDVVSYSIPKN